MQFCSHYGKSVFDRFCRDCLENNGGCIVIVGAKEAS
jgi:hypothetical protein